MELTRLYSGIGNSGMPGFNVNGIEPGMPLHLIRARGWQKKHDGEYFLGPAIAIFRSGEVSVVTGTQLFIGEKTLLEKGQQVSPDRREIFEALGLKLSPEASDLVRGPLVSTQTMSIEQLGLRIHLQADHVTYLELSGEQHPYPLGPKNACLDKPFFSAGHLRANISFESPSSALKVDLMIEGAWPGMSARRLDLAGWKAEPEDNYARYYYSPSGRTQVQVIHSRVISVVGSRLETTTGKVLASCGDERRQILSSLELLLPADADPCEKAPSPPLELSYLGWGLTVMATDEVCGFALRKVDKPHSGPIEDYKIETPAGLNSSRAIQFLGGT